MTRIENEMKPSAEEVPRTRGEDESHSSLIIIDLRLECVDEEAAEALELVLMPDNRYFPDDQRFESIRKGEVLEFRIWSPRVKPALATLRSLLGDAKLFEQIRAL